MIQTFEWADPPRSALIEFIKSQRNPRSSPQGAQPIVEGVDHWTVKAFQAHCEECCQRLDYPVARWRFWGSIMDRSHFKPDGWCKGFPHEHGWDGLTLIHYLQVADEGGELVLLNEKGRNMHVYKPAIGTTATVDGRTSHGVRRIFGDTPRITIIATGYPTP